MSTYGLLLTNLLYFLDSNGNNYLHYSYFFGKINMIFKEGFYAKY